MVKRRWGKFAVLLLSAAAALTATAASAEGEPETGAFNAFTVKASNGYKMRVLAFSRKGYRNGEVLILVGGKGRSVSYLAPATVTDTRVHAELGALGRIDVEFVPSGLQETARSSCDPADKLTYEKGSYVGAVEFRGEEGYTRATATRVPLWMRLLVDFGCASLVGGELSGSRLPGARLRVRRRLDDGNLLLQVNQNRPGGRVWAEAAIEEKRGPIRIAREVEQVYPATSFDFDPKLRFATLRPPPPFSGAALFLRDAKPQNRWRGNLVVDFPGNSNVALTGSRFRSSLVHAHLDKGPSRLGGGSRSSLSRWPSTKPSPIASAMSSLLGPN